MHVLCKISVVRYSALRTTIRIGEFDRGWDVNSKSATASSNMSITT